MPTFQSNEEKLIFEQQFERYLWTCQLFEKYIQSEIQNKICLDIGCGTGNGILAFKKYGAKEALGIDNDLKFMGGTLMEEIALNEAIDLSGSQRISGNVENYEFGEKLFDIILMYDVLEHLAEPFTILKAAYRLLKKEGILLISSSPLYYSPIGHHCWNLYPKQEFPWIHLYDPNFSENVIKKHAWCGRSYLGLNKLTISEIIRIVKRFNFNIEKQHLIEANEDLYNHKERYKILEKVKDPEDLFIEGIDLVLRK
jgi:SAM-dependent methyltransferase